MPQAQNHDLDVCLALGYEHICLESEERSVEARPRVNTTIRVGPTFKFVSRLRGCETALAFSTDDCLAVRLGRPGKVIRKYLVDLRFIDTAATAKFRIAWRSWLVTASLAGLGALSYWLSSQFIEPGWRQIGLQASFIAAMASMCIGFLSLYQSCVVIDLRSTHGDAHLVKVMAGLSNIRAARSFVTELSRRVEAARGRSAQSRQHFLRDEMREHHRLWTEGVLSPAAYEASKRRILASHA